MNPIGKQPQDLDRWENEGGALPAEEAHAEAVRPKNGPVRRNQHDRFFANLMGEAENVLKDLEAEGGHGEVHSDAQREAMTVLVRRHLVNRATNGAGRVIYEITNAGRRHLRELPSGK